MSERATIYFNKGAATEKSFLFDSFNESVGMNNLNLNVHYELNDGEEVADFAELNGLEFETMVMQDKSGNEIPYFGSYTKIGDISVNYFGADNIYTVNVTLA